MPSLLRIRSEHVLWQKERLINVALGHLPKHVKKVAWLDCDILFSNPNWLIETSELLDNYPIVQPFQTANRLPRGWNDMRGAVKFGIVLVMKLRKTKKWFQKEIFTGTVSQVLLGQQEEISSKDMVYTTPALVAVAIILWPMLCVEIFRAHVLIVFQ